MFRWIILLTSLMHASVSAELVFEKELIRLAPDPSAEKVTAKFHFTYKGEKAILVQEVDANCGCIHAEADKKRYAKGDKGEIEFVFELGDREGLQKSRVWMSYLEERKPGDPPLFPPGELGPMGEDPNETIAPTIKSLQVELDIPVVVQVEPKMTEWKVGSKPETKEIKVTMNHSAPIHLKSAASTREGVKAEIVEVKKGKSYIVKLTPSSTETKQLGMLTLKTDCDIERHQKKLAFFSFVPADVIKNGTPPLVAPSGAGG